MNGPYSPWPGYPPPPYYPQQTPVYIPIPTPPPQTVRIPKGSGKKAFKKNGIYTGLQALKDLDQLKKDWESYLAGGGPKKEDKKPEGLLKRTFSFGETVALVLFLSLPTSLLLHQAVRVFRIAVFQQ